MIFISSAMVEHTLSLFSQRKVVFIVSDHSEAIAQTILDSMKQSATFLRGMGAFTKREKNVLMTVINNIQLKKLEQITFTHDPQALFIVENPSPCWDRTSPGARSTEPAGLAATGLVPTARQDALRFRGNPHLFRTRETYVGLSA